MYDRSDPERSRRRAMTTMVGGCHCGNIRFELRWPAGERQIAVRECGCTFCRKHGGAWTSHIDAELDAGIDASGSVTKYAFGTKTADFYVCSTCGVVPFVTSEINDRLCAVVNVNAFTDAGDVSFTCASTDFDGEDTGARLARRARNWIPAVRISEPGTGKSR